MIITNETAQDAQVDLAAVLAGERPPVYEAKKPVTHNRHEARKLQAQARRQDSQARQAANERRQRQAAKRRGRKR